MAYDIRFKKQVLSRLEQGHRHRETALLFGIGTTSIKNWKKRLRTGEGLAPRIRKRAPKKIPPEQLRQAIEKNPDAYGTELAALFGCCYASVWNALRKQGFTLKKKRRPSRNATKPCAKRSAKP
jgi:transposase